MTALYIAGPMSNLPDFNYPAFFDAARRLRAAGYDVENPAENKPEGTASWLAYMRMSLVQISRVDGLALLPGWLDSKGARIEARLADELGLRLWGVGEWVKAAETEAADHEPGCRRWGRVRPSARCLCPMTRIVAEPPTDTERVIWRTLADELDAWLDGGDGQEVLL